MSKLLNLVSAAFFALAASAASAAMVTEDYRFVAGSGSASPVTGAFRLAFDDSADIDNQATGLDFLFLSNGYLGTPKFSYSKKYGVISLSNATTFVAGCSYSPGYFCLFFRDDSTRPDQAVFGSGNGHVSTDVVFDAISPGVPEPATWGMMLAGLGATGLAMRRRRQIDKRAAW